MARNNQVTAATAPHSWDLEHWPPTVWPHNESRARYLLRAFRTELLNAGALTRKGRELVVLGAAYVRWLQAGTKDVPGFVCNTNPKQAPATPDAQSHGEVQP